MKKYKIVFIVNYFPSVSETFIMNQIIDLIERGHSIRIFSFNKGRQNFHQAVERYRLVEKTTYFKSSHRPLINKLGWTFAFVFKNFHELWADLGFGILKPRLLRKAIYDQTKMSVLSRFLRGAGFDIVHAHFGQRGALVANLMAKGRIANFKFVTSFHGYDLVPQYVHHYQKKYKNLFRYADAVTVNSKYLESLLLQVCPNPRNLVLLHEGLRTEQYKPSIGRDYTKKEFNIVFCGRLVEFKAPDLAVRIIDILVNKRNHVNIKLRIIGDGKLREEVERLVDMFHLQEHVFLLGALSQEDVINEMNRSDVFLLPGIHERETGRAEAQGLVIQEAQAMEIPVVVSDAGGMKYGLLDGVTGFVVAQGDIEGFADKIELLIRDRKLGREMGNKGRDFVIGNFDTKILGDQLESVYAKMIPPL